MNPRGPTFNLEVHHALHERLRTECVSLNMIKRGGKSSYMNLTWGSGSLKKRMTSFPVHHMIDGMVVFNPVKMRNGPSLAEQVLLNK